jgi:hypothetical protein
MKAVGKEILYCRGISSSIKKFVLEMASERGVAVGVYLEHLLKREKKVIDDRKKKKKPKKKG